MGDVEWNIKLKAGLGNDVCLYVFDNRKILKRETVFEHQNVILKRTNRKFETEECDLIDLNVNINIQTKARCFAD
jgi:uncharacterized protein (DUF924 family)